MYLQDRYKVTVTNDIEVLKTLVFSADILMLDIEPSDKAEVLLKEIKSLVPGITIILTYVFKQKSKDLEAAIRNYVDLIFYKPFDLNEVTTKISLLPQIHNN
jgi:DNA-binding response OmpR family regulator